jgi:rhamnose utilization protein RhaD (predicted bifunctional aldolase and dehydrogenase)
MNNKFNIEELKKYSEKIGNNIDWIQGAGGNTSVKDEETIWVKASGCWLSNSNSNDIFISVLLTEINQSITNNNLSEITNNNLHQLRPSIETSLHALMPHKYVFHTHSVAVISIAVLQNGKEYLEKIFKDINWVWVPYEMPGINLAKKIQKVLSEKADVIVLANHGIVVGAEKAKNAYKLLNDIELLINRSLRNTTKADSDELSGLIEKTNYRICKYSIVNSLANDELSLEIMQTGTLYPDHVVFLGPGPMKILTIAELGLFLGNLEYVSKNPVIVVRDMGIIVDKTISQNAEAMLYCLAGVLLRLNKNEKLCYLSQENEADLLGLDSEQYRKSIQK